MNNLTNSQQLFVNIIEKTIDNNKLSHAYLIETNNTLENTKLIYNFIKLMLCKNNRNKVESVNCNDCNVCNLIDNGNYPDIKVIEAVGQTIKKEQLLELQDEFRNKSFLDNKLIYIIKDAEKLNMASANTILKFLEEPEDNIIAILLTNNRYSILETILSRCQILTLSSDDYNLEISDNLIELIRFISSGKDLFINYNYISKNILVDKETSKKILSDLENLYLYYLEVLSDESSNINENLFKLIGRDSSDKIIKNIGIIEEWLPKLNYNVNFKLWLDSLFARFMEV